ncbi:hypothetical protein BB560_005711 [Smittium megazygosporum]|uniref:Uncharacterized protein n=1 Tax=Smittium megazygosporum TaxID=133381 RepID=A0A2T9Z0C0_9FUNG|nr:hypothetical protein BB560_005711 [Smittium megazygosporum]
MVLVGNKSDDIENREVSTSEGEEFAQMIGCSFYETSAKRRINVENAFYEVAKSIRLTNGGTLNLNQSFQNMHSIDYHNNRDYPNMNSIDFHSPPENSTIYASNQKNIDYSRPNDQLPSKNNSSPNKSVNTNSRRHILRSQSTSNFKSFSCRCSIM